MIEHEEFNTKQMLWERSGGNNLLRGHKDFQRLYKDVATDPNLGYNDENEKPLWVCMDEGVVSSQKYKEMSLIASAGSGVLDPQISRALEGRIRGRASHEGCAAAALATQSLPFSELIKSDDMNRLGDLHDARTVYMDFTRQGFNPNRINGLPKGFLVSQGFIGSQAVGLHDGDLAVQIALGKGGFGDLFTDKARFYVIGLYDEQSYLRPSRMWEEVNAIAGNGNRANIATELVRVGN